MFTLLRGLLAGAAGAAALNATSYIDMAVRGRPASDVPAKVVGKLAPFIPEKRRGAYGALAGYGVAAGIGLAYAALQSKMRVPPPIGAILIAAAAMAASDVVAAKLRVTDPEKWTKTDWIADAVPHAAYGIVGALTLEMLSV